MADFRGLTRNLWTGTWSSSGTHPIVLDTEIRGGLRFVSGALGDRLTDIPGQQLQEGMIAYLKTGYDTYSSNTYYTYRLLSGEERNPATGIMPNNDANWDEARFSSKDINVRYIAGENISSYRVVHVQNDYVFLADKDTISDRDEILGVTFESSAINDLISVRSAGEIRNPAWTLTPGPVYLSTAGTLQQTLPTTGFWIQIGVATSSDTIMINITRVIEDHDHDADYINIDENVDGGSF